MCVVKAVVNGNYEQGKEDHFDYGCDDDCVWKFMRSWFVRVIWIVGDPWVGLFLELCIYKSSC